MRTEPKHPTDEAVRTEPDVSSPPAHHEHSAARMRIMEDHARLRLIIREVDRVAVAVAAGDLDKVPLLKVRAGDLYRVVAEHVGHEEMVLIPILRKIDAWGNVRCDQLKADHRGQLEMLERASADLDFGGEDLGRSVQSMCWEILHDMRREEHDLLHPDLWRDEMVVVEFGG
jgi:hypothetical protein